MFARGHPKDVPGHVPCSNLQRTVFSFITHFNLVEHVTIFMVFALGQYLHGATPKTSQDMLFALGQCLHGPPQRRHRTCYLLWANVCMRRSSQRRHRTCYLVRDALISRHKHGGQAHVIASILYLICVTKLTYFVQFGLHIRKYIIKRYVVTLFKLDHT